MLEKRADEALERPGVLAERGVFELDHVDAVQQNLALDQPFDLGLLKFVDGVRRDGSEMWIAVGRSHVEFDGFAVAEQFFVGRALRSVIEHHDGVYFARSRQFAQRVIHEQAAAVRGRADGIGRDEEHAGRSGSGRKRENRS